MVSRIERCGITDLGPVDAVRFLQSFDLGRGDYTKERAPVLDLELDEIVSEIRKRRKQEECGEG